ncbi:sulfite exporter TauE/SafE family protein [Variovorax terrae]|uniref:Probable membrane transporter protein n=1 Tax=Variovorax terrae TaxID=2923278 RepID=A0A9X1VT76_9BURK|nr:sulfite exporter TauE/SafE family protein [Variovorax terrae]MCJ0761624.1 sulfite exporter TauE/SafE family protein [Variovorax terrae]
MPMADVGTMLVFGAVLLGAGFVAGFLGGMIGAGGGLIVIPILYHTFTGLGVDPAVRMHLVVGTALAAVVPTSLLGARAHWLRGNVDRTIVKRLALPIFFGASLAGAVSGHLGNRALSLGFVLAAALVSLNMMLKTGVKLGNGLPGRFCTGVIGAAIGSVSTLVGIGGATLTVPVLHAFRTPMPVAVGTAATLGALIGLPGAIAFMIGGWGDVRVPPGSLGYVNGVAAALIFPASAVAVSWGARFTRQVNERALRAMFAAFLALTAARMLFSLP